MTSDSGSASAALYERARRVLPGGTTRVTTHSAPHPIYLESGNGAHVTDLDGIERLDFNGNFTTMIHGYAHPEIDRAVIDQLARGSALPMATEAEVALAELLCARVASIDKVRFMNSGTDAVMSAIKASRAHTGRPKIAKCEGAYHGMYDYAEASLDPAPSNWGPGGTAPVANSAGTPQGVLDDVVVIPFNDCAATARIIEENAAGLAGILVDPMPNRAGMIPATPEYLSLLREVTRANGIILILDEVLCFRIGYHGAQGEFGVEPDLTVLGKIIGGGYPVGAVGGGDHFMAVFDPTGGKPALPQSGTYAGNPVTMVAGLVGMELLTPAAFERLNGLGERARAGITAAFAELGVPGQVTGRGSLFRIHMTARVLTGYRSAYPTEEERARLGRLCGYLLDNGILIATTGMGALSTPMVEADIDRLIEGVRAGLATLGPAA